MKKIFKGNHRPTLFVLFLLGVLTIACSTDDDSSVAISVDQEITAANSITTSGSWRVSNYNDDSIDETDDYNGFTFTFEDNGTLVASINTVETQGTWSIVEESDDSTDDGDDSNDIDFNIFFAVTGDDVLEDLSDDWDIVTISETSISLRDVSGGDGSIDILTFSKI